MCILSKLSLVCQGWLSLLQWLIRSKYNRFPCSLSSSLSSTGGRYHPSSFNQQKRLYVYTLAYTLSQIPAFHHQLLMKVGFSKDADNRSSWVMPVSQPLLTFSIRLPFGGSEEKKGGSKVLNHCSKIFQISRINVQISAQLTQYDGGVGHKTQLSAHHFWIYLMYLHHLVYPVVFTS